MVGGEIRLTAVGDIMFDKSLAGPRVFYYFPEWLMCSAQNGNLFGVPFVNDEQSHKWLIRNGVPVTEMLKDSHRDQSIPIKGPENVLDFDYPFHRIRNELLKSAVVLGNLECPLSTRGRAVKNDTCYRAEPGFAKALANANISIVSFANNHCMDFGETAFIDTLEALQRSGIDAIGAIIANDPREPFVIRDVSGLCIGFLAYTLVGPDLVYALPGESGVLPLNPARVEDDIRILKQKTDFLVISAHWGVEGHGIPTPQLVRLAHYCVDKGADLIIGHHTHIPGSIEIYKQKPILYSLGNFIFGHDHSNWIDNIIVHLSLSETGAKQLEIVPIQSVGPEQFQPSIASGERAHNLLQFVSRISEGFATRFAIGRERAFIEL